MSTSSDWDATLRKAIYLLHSNHPQSATELRLLLEEQIKKRYGPTKTISHLVTKEHLEMERNFPGVETEEPEQSGEAESTAMDEEVINLTNSPVKTISDSPETIADSDDVPMLTMATNEEVENLKEFGDLNCCVCGEMMFTANNRLIECSQCGALYHQECHKPTITNEETCDEKERTWQCNNCNDKPSTSRAAAAAAAAVAATVEPPPPPAPIVESVMEEPLPLISKTKSSASSSRSSSSSNSSSPFHKQERSSSSSGKHYRSSSSSSKSRKEERSRVGGATAVIMPSINIISAPDKAAFPAATSKSKSSSTHSSSSKSSSRHHESSKRKLSK